MSDRGFGRACPSGNHMVDRTWFDVDPLELFDAFGHYLYEGDKVIVLKDCDCFNAGDIAEVVGFEDTLNRVEIGKTDQQGEYWNAYVSGSILSKE